jgi:large subunit ribosomal protein L29
VKLAVLWGKDTRQLMLDLQAVRKELFELRFRAASEEVAKSGRFSDLRRTIARLLTIMRERDLKIDRGAGSTR